MSRVPDGDATPVHGTFYAKAVGKCPACGAIAHPEPDKECSWVCPWCETILYFFPGAGPIIGEVGE